MVSLWPLWGCARNALRQMTNFQVLRSVIYSPYRDYVVRAKHVVQVQQASSIERYPCRRWLARLDTVFLHTWSEANVDGRTPQPIWSAEIPVETTPGRTSLWKGGSIDCGWWEALCFAQCLGLRSGIVKFPSVSWCEVRSNPLSRSDPSPSSHEKNQ